jgi:Zn-dependent protease
VTCHEVAHGYVAFKLGDPTAQRAGRLTLNPLKHLDFVGSLLLPLILKLSGAPILFGYAKPVPVDFGRLRSRPKAILMVSAAGVAANLALAALSGVFFQVLLRFEPYWRIPFLGPLVLDLVQMLGYSVLINSVLAVFNLIPIPPLDGSRLLAHFLPPTLRQPYVRLERFGMLILIALLMSGSLSHLMNLLIRPLVSFFLGR